MSCTSPLTVAMTIRPCGLAPADFSASINGIRYATAFFITRALLTIFREIDQTFGRVVASVQEHVFDAFAQLGIDLLVNRELACVYDRHVEPGADRVKQKCGVHRLAHSVVAAKRK